MQALQITFRGMESSQAVETRVRELAERLHRFHDRITSCHVTIQAPHKHQRQSAPIEIHLRVGVPNGEIVVSHGGQDHADEAPNTTIRAAFDAAKRKLEAQHARLFE